jgi:hypothetical protein
MQPNTARNDLRLDLALVVFLIALDVAARLLPHAWGFSPVAASGLFAARMLRLPVLALIVPVAAMALTGWALGADDWRISLITYAGIAVPALLGIASRRYQGALPVVAAVIAGSLIFFALSNVAVWAFSGMYPLTMAGLAECFVAALPFLDKTVLGDLIWTGVLFGGAWLVQHRPSLAKQRAH